MYSYWDCKRAARITIPAMAGLLGIILLVFPAKAAVPTGTSITRPINVSAEVPTGLTLEMRIVDQLLSAQVPSMDFGELVRTGDEFRAKTYFKVYLKINSVGDSCELTQIGTLLTRVQGAETMPSGAYIAKPSYEESENSGQAIPTTAKLGAFGKVAQSILLYSDTGGQERTVTVTYTLTGDPVTNATEVIPISQKSGSYAGTVQFTLTTV